MTCDLFFDFPENQSVMYGLTCVEQFFHEWFNQGYIEYSVKEFTHSCIVFRVVLSMPCSCDELFDKCNNYFESVGVAVRCTQIVFDGKTYKLVSNG